MAPIFTSLFNLITATRSFETRPSPFLRFVPRLTVSISNFSLTRILPSPLLSSPPFCRGTSRFSSSMFLFNLQNFTDSALWISPLKKFPERPNVLFSSPLFCIDRFSLEIYSFVPLDFKKEVDAVPRRPRKS